LTEPAIRSIEGPQIGGQEHRESLDWSAWAIALNEHHPNFQDIREALRAANIPLTEIFGDTSDGPSKWIISLSYHLPFAFKVQLLRVVLPFGFDGIQLWEPQREADENEDVYIGSYGGGSYAEVTEQLFALLNTHVEAADLNHYYTRNKTKRI
jgi:hypothetical protein